MSISKKKAALKRPSCLTSVFSIPLILAFFLCACSTQKASKDSAPKTQTIRINATELTGGQLGSVIEKDLITIIVTPKKIIVNNKTVRNIDGVKKILMKHQKPVITIRAHKCADSKLATQIMGLSQDQTDTPIPFASYGSYEDPECKK